MNENKTYQLIAAKLEQLPVPDMADMIWARIEAQLDIDLPPKDGGNDPGPAPKPKPVGRRIALGAATIAVLITIFQFFKNREENQQSIPVIPVQQNSTVITRDSAADLSPPLQRTTNNNQRVLPPGLTTQIDKADSITDSVAAPLSSVLPPVLLSDSIGSIIPPLVQNKVVDTTPPRRRRGVSLNDSDYRIIPKRDSN